MNSHEKKIYRLMNDKNNAEADMANYRHDYSNAEYESERRIAAGAIRSCMKRLQKIYKELDNSVQQNDYLCYGEEIDSRYSEEECEEMMQRLAPKQEDNSPLTFEEAKAKVLEQVETATERMNDARGRGWNDAAETYRVKLQGLQTALGILGRVQGA